MRGDVCLRERECGEGILGGREMRLGWGLP